MSTKRKSPVMQDQTNGQNDDVSSSKDDLKVEVKQKQTSTVLQSDIDSIKVKNGDVVFVQVDINGNESSPSKTSAKTFEQYFANAVHKGTNQPKYQLKKK